MSYNLKRSGRRAKFYIFRFSTHTIPTTPAATSVRPEDGLRAGGVRADEEEDQPVERNEDEDEAQLFPTTARQSPSRSQKSGYRVGNPASSTSRSRTNAPPALSYR